MDIEQKQALLLYLRKDIGVRCSPDGSWGSNSQEATRAFQGAYGLQEDGRFGPATEKRILEVIYRHEEPHRRPSTPLGGDFWQDPSISRYFQKSEFRCRCVRCGGFPAEPAELLVRACVKVRKHFDLPFLISSGVRCKIHNREVGGVYNSRHLTGHAVDFTIVGKSAAEILAYVRILPEIRYAYAINASYVHMDIGP